MKLSPVLTELSVHDAKHNHSKDNHHATSAFSEKQQQQNIYIMEINSSVYIFTGIQADTTCISVPYDNGTR